MVENKTIGIEVNPFSGMHSGYGAYGKEAFVSAYPRGKCDA